MKKNRLRANKSSRRSHTPNQIHQPANVPAVKKRGVADWKQTAFKFIKCPEFWAFCARVVAGQMADGIDESSPETESTERDLVQEADGDGDPEDP